MKNEPEYANRATPPVIYLCGRCKRGLLVFLGVGDNPIYEPSADRPHAWCYGCGYTGPGIKYVLGLSQPDDGGAPLQTDLPPLRLHTVVQ